MKKRQLKNLEVSSIGLGCMGLSEFYGQTSEKQSEEILSKALGLGINFFDTADMYGNGENEKLLGRHLKQHRSKIVLASKFGIVREAGDSQFRGVNASPAYVVKSIERTLQNLQTDYLDLYYLHRMDPNTPIEDTVEAMSKLVKAGKIRHIGLSEASAELIKRAHAVHPITAIQTEYSLLTRTAENNGVLDCCEALDIGFVAYSPLSRGLLSNKDFSSIESNDVRAALPRFQKANQEANQRLISLFHEMAANKQCSTAQLSLAWVLAQNERIVPIPGTKQLKYLIDNAKAVDIALSETELERIEQACNAFTVAGTRYTKEQMHAYQLEDEL